MALFQVRKAFEVPDESSYVLAESITEGDIRPGMWLDFTSGVSWRRGPIDAVEFHQGSKAGDVWLIFRCTPESLAKWRLMVIGKDVMNVFEPPTMILD